MASSYTTNKVLEKPGNGDYVDTWNVPVNGDMDIIDQAFGGVTSLNATGGSATLTSAQYRSLILSISGAMAASVIYTIPSGKGGQWIVYNNTTDSTGGPWSVTIASGGGGTSYTVTRGQRVLIYSDGTNINVAYAYPTEALIPSGLISLWSGSIASIPTGWYLCNGSNGTPDLRDRFIVGAGSTYAVAATGGSANAVVVSHTHTATVTDPGHNHTYSRTVVGGVVFTDHSGQDTLQGYDFPNTSTATTGISVSNSTEGVSGTNANLPPYYALAYIMKA
jgi:hypothetical protein